jgi:hypothetical protein
MKMEEDEWGKDPSVRSMRRVFEAIEAGQERLLKSADVSLMEPRLGQWRKMALHMFEQKWEASAQSGVRLDEKGLIDLYLRCLAKVLEAKGIVVPSDLPASNPAIDRLIGEEG